jgi:hypothetical protein
VGDGLEARMGRRVGELAKRESDGKVEAEWGHEIGSEAYR